MVCSYTTIALWPWLDSECTKVNCFRTLLSPSTLRSDPLLHFYTSYVIKLLVRTQKQITLLYDSHLCRFGAPRTTWVRWLVGPFKQQLNSLTKKNHLGPMISWAIHTTLELSPRRTTWVRWLVGPFTQQMNSLTKKNHLGPMVSGANHTIHVLSH